MGPNPLGKKISSFTANRPDGSPDPNSIKSWTVIGVIENFHFANMREDIAPLGMFLQRSNGYVAFRFESKSTKEVLEKIETLWKEFAPGNTFEYSFLNDDYGRMYNAEKRLGKTFGIFAGLAIIIACLGLFALAAFTAEQRTKEIGIRKTLGASVNSIVFLLSREYGKLVLIAFVLKHPNCMVWHPLVDAKLFLSCFSRLHNLYPGRRNHIVDCRVDHWLSMYPGCNGEPGQSLRSE